MKSTQPPKCAGVGMAPVYTSYMSADETTRLAAVARMSSPILRSERRSTDGVTAASPSCSGSNSSSAAPRISQPTISWAHRIVLRSSWIESVGSTSQRAK